MKEIKRLHQNLLEQIDELDAQKDELRKRMTQFAIDIIADTPKDEISRITGKGLSTINALTTWRYNATLKWLRKFNSSLVEAMQKGEL